jgi:hypothetical protein
LKTIEEHYQTLFGVTKPWAVRHVAEYVESREVRVVIRLRDGAEVECPRCGKMAEPLPDSMERKTMETMLWHYKLLLDCAAPRCCCEAHGAFAVQTPMDNAVTVTERNPEELPPHDPVEEPPSVEVVGARSGELILLGMHHPYANAKDAIVIILTELAKRNSGFLEKLSRHPDIRGKKRHYIARTSAEIYPDRPDLQTHHATLPGGWLLGTNISNFIKERIVRAATEVAGLEYGRDIVVDF